MTHHQETRVEGPIELWPDATGPDGSLISTDPRHPDDPLLRNVTRPTLTAHLPDPAAATGTGVVICPGGAHHFLSIVNEGSAVARWFAARGIAAFVLHYRLLPTARDEAELTAQMEAVMNVPGRMTELSRDHRPIAVADGARALEMVRGRAADWGVATDRVGILGFSAGAFVATATTLDTPAPGRPDFLAAIYGSVWEDLTVPAEAPPLFQAWASDDTIGALIVESCLALYTAWQSAGRPVEAHAYAAGGHGFGMHHQGLPSDGWIDQLHTWLGQQGLLG
ncbi:alpha/beta hydrolase [Cellulomonas sp. P24]|uniref:alpha/beta hydrolase n=1 Tax=Cellulomonas sp. P24 TaxID=2885206 RepID=UPI0028703895|nr:alpha/beta hydrolase [Cellulomonas sp. P24]